MRQKVKKYIKKCLCCQQNKAARHQKYRNLQLTKVFTVLWDDITMNFVIKLLKFKNLTTNEVYDSIMIIVNKLIKYFIMILFKKMYTAEQLRYILLDRLIRNHDISQTVISDRDKLFTFNYWKTLMALIRTKQKMSTVFHSETDEQTEWTNQTMKIYLQHYINRSHNNWVQLLLMTQLAYNNSDSETIKRSLFFANYEKNSNLFLKLHQYLTSNTAIVQAEHMKEIHTTLTKQIKSANTSMMKYVNQKQKTAPQLKMRDKIYLLTKNLRVKKSRICKLDHVRVRSFLIEKIKKSINFQLQLSADVKIHSVFHIFLLESADTETLLQITFHYQQEKENIYEAERILEYDSQQYLMKWKEYSDYESMWESSEHLMNCKKLLRKFHQQNSQVSSKSQKRGCSG